ncbi:MAG: hypothetical protein ACTSVI_09360, partial [Promethearchaeota archaeon]
NNFYHSSMKHKFKEYLQKKYLIPVRKVDLAPEYHYCEKCGALLDFIHDDVCPKCKTPINKCVICGDIIKTPKNKETPINVEVNKPKKKITLEATISLKNVIYKMERKLDPDDEVIEREIECRECGAKAHVDEFYSWLKLRGTCPACGKKINEDHYYF